MVGYVKLKIKNKGKIYPIHSTGNNEPRIKLRAKSHADYFAKIKEYSYSNKWICHTQILNTDTKSNEFWFRVRFSSKISKKIEHPVVDYNIYLSNYIYVIKKIEI